MSQRPEYEFLGSTAESTLHKLKGLVIGIQYNLANSTQVVVQTPVGKDNKIPEAYLLDMHTCKFTNKRAKGKIPLVEDFDIQLGDEVTDLVSEFKGICTAIVCGVNGCVEVVVVAKVDKEMKGRVHAQNHKRFKITGEAKITIPPAIIDGNRAPAGATRITASTQRGA